MLGPRLRRVTLLGAACLLVSAASAQAATITVTTTGDDLTPNDATVSLREAITAVNSGNSLGDPDILAQNPGTYGTNDTVVVPANSSHYGLNNEILVSKPVTIQGAGAGSSVVDGQSHARVFHATSGVGAGGTVTFQGVTITGGKATGSSGGGVLGDNSSGSLVLTGVVVTGNTVTVNSAAAGFNGGGGIDENSGSVTLTASTVSNNAVTANNNPSGFNGGGGIAQDGGAVVLVGSTVSGNTVTANGNASGSNGGGGILNDGPSTITLTGSTISGNSATTNGSGNGFNGGGGILNNGTTLSLTNSSVSGNTANNTGNTANGFSGGGGILNNSTNARVILTQSIVSGNALNLTDTHNFDGGGGILDSGGGLDVTQSTISGNTAALSGSPTQSGGGGVADLSLGSVYVNSTISDNTTTAGAGIQNGGGGMRANAVSVKLTNVTIAGNSSAAAPGGGLYSGGGTSTTKNSIVAQNTAGSGGGNCDAAGPGTLISQGYNLEDTNTCHFTAGTDKTGTPAGLGPLQSNGGPTHTRLLLAGSPAIDAIPQASCTDQSGSPVSTDQRGFSRLDAGETACDSGAYETQEPGSLTTVVNNAATNAPWSGTEIGGASAYDTATVVPKNGVKPGGTVTYSFFGNGSCSGTPASTQQVALSSTGSVPNSTATGPLAAGSYSYLASYSGDGNYQATSGACEPVTVIGPPANASPPTISGNPKAGKTLSVARGVWSGNPTSYAYQWQRCNPLGGSCGSIGGATSQSYTLVPADVGHGIRVVETAANLAAHVSASSQPTDVVAFPARAGIGRIAVHGKAVKVPVSCQGDAGARCALALKLGTGQAGLGSKTVSLIAGQSKTVMVSLNSAGKRRLKRHHPLRAMLLITQSGQPVGSRTVSFR